MALAILISKRFNPGHISQMEANAKLLEKNGFDVRYRVNRKYLFFPDSTMKGKEAGLRDWLVLGQGDLFIVWFSSISVIFDLLLIRLLTRATTVFVHHEPYISFSHYRVAGFSYLKSLRVTAISFVNWIICTLSKKIILQSVRAYTSIPNAKIEPIRYGKLNMLFADETSSQTQNLPRGFVSYIGTIAEDHAFDDFVRIMHGCIVADMLQPLRFLIATRSQIPKHHRVMIDRCITSGRLIVQSESPMTNNEINQFYAQSFVVWNAYRRFMQSGVLAKAYMFGSPVLVATSNQCEHFQEGVHGALISDHCTLQEFRQAINRLQSRWPIISQNCRNCYLQHFDYRSVGSMFMNFVLDKK